MSQDQIYLHPDYQPGPFEFTPEVVEVFDDMVERSVPYYHQVQELMAELAWKYARGRPIYDLGCSTGTTLVKLLQMARGGEIPRLVGWDRSQPMLQACRRKLQQQAPDQQVELRAGDLTSACLFESGAPGCVILSLVMQFLPPAERLPLLRIIYEQLLPGGALLVFEKTRQADPQIEAHYVNLHHRFKQQKGYSLQEIERKREALENRLIPWLPEENLGALRAAGFEPVSGFFGWLNFQGYLAVKGDAP